MRPGASAGTLTSTGKEKENSSKNKSTVPESSSLNMDHDRAGRTVKQPSTLKDVLAGETSNKLIRQPQIKDNMEPPSKEITPPLIQRTPSVGVVDKTNMNLKPSRNNDNYSKCKTSKMDEHEKQRVAQLKRQRLVKATTAGGKRRYQQRKGNC
jgi:hypothetical protein